MLTTANPKSNTHLNMYSCALIEVPSKGIFLAVLKGQKSGAADLLSIYVQQKILCH